MACSWRDSVETWTYHDPFPLLGAECVDKVVLPSSSRPDGGKFAKTCCEREITQDAEDEAVEK